MAKKSTVFTCVKPTEIRCLGEGSEDTQMETDQQDQKGAKCVTFLEHKKSSCTRNTRCSAKMSFQNPQTLKFIFHLKNEMAQIPLKLSVSEDQSFHSFLCLYRIHTEMRRASENPVCEAHFVRGSCCHSHARPWFGKRHIKRPWTGDTLSTIRHRPASIVTSRSIKAIFCV